MAGRSKEKLYSISIKTGKKKYIMKFNKHLGGCQIYGNFVIASREWRNKAYKDKNKNLYNTEWYIYNLKTKKKIQLLRWYEQ